MLEIERKFLMKKDEAVKYIKANLKLFDIEEIVQIYIIKNKDMELRVREITTSENEVYYTKTRKIGNGLVREEIEESITEAEYNETKQNAIAIIFKKRFTIKDTSQCFDLYSNGLVTFEIEFPTEAEANSYSLDHYLNELLDKEVTGDKTYSNYEMARKV